MNKEIITYELTTDFNFPLFRNHGKHICCGNGDKIISIDGDVYVRNWEGVDNSFSKTLCGKEFLDLNPTIFIKKNK